MTIALIILAVAIVAHHLGHAHANYRHGRARGKRGINLYWSSARGPWISVPGPFHTRIGRHLLRMVSTTNRDESVTKRERVGNGFPVRSPQVRKL